MKSASAERSIEMIVSERKNESFIGVLVGFKNHDTWSPCSRLSSCLAVVHSRWSAHYLMGPIDLKESHFFSVSDKHVAVGQ